MIWIWCKRNCWFYFCIFWWWFRSCLRGNGKCYIKDGNGSGSNFQNFWVGWSAWRGKSTMRKTVLLNRYFQEIFQHIEGCCLEKIIWMITPVFDQNFYPTWKISSRLHSSKLHVTQFKVLKAIFKSNVTMQCNLCTFSFAQRDQEIFEYAFSMETLILCYHQCLRHCYAAIVNDKVFFLSHLNNISKAI